MRINLANGATSVCEIESKTWKEIEEDPQAAKRVRGVTLHVADLAVTLTTPKGFHRTAYLAAVGRQNGEVVAEEVEIQADDVRLRLRMYSSGLARVDLIKTGRPRHLVQFRRK